jgi:hypothetical protein
MQISRLENAPGGEAEAREEAQAEVLDMLSDMGGLTLLRAAAQCHEWPRRWPRAATPERKIHQRPHGTV